jgi:uncharacterized protein (DUF2252 family)
MRAKWNEKRTQQNGNRIKLDFWNVNRTEQNKNRMVREKNRIDENITE